jgi:SAM-dependent methyltransferase
MPSLTKKDILREWRESAPYWAKHSAIVRAMFAPITSALIEAAAINRGDSVLDVAGGSGEPAITIAQAIGASVVFTDPVAEMVVTSRRQSSDLGLTNIAFTRCAGEALPFVTGTFDVVVCRLGIMLFPDPAAAIREILRVLKPDGRLALAVWSTSASNPFFHVVANIVSRYVESPAEDPDAPGAFRFSERGKLAGWLRGAGAVEVTERILEFSLEAPLKPKQFWEVRCELSDTLRSKVASLLPEQVANLAREVEEAGAAFHIADQMKFPAEVLIVSARK